MFKSHRETSRRKPIRPSVRVRSSPALLCLTLPAPSLNGAPGAVPQRYGTSVTALLSLSLCCQIRVVNVKRKRKMSVSLYRQKPQARSQAPVDRPRRKFWSSRVIHGCPPGRREGTCSVTWCVEGRGGGGGCGRTARGAATRLVLPPATEQFVPSRRKSLKPCQARKRGQVSSKTYKERGVQKASFECPARAICHAARKAPAYQRKQSRALP